MPTPLAIATHWPPAPSETFVRQHLDGLAPGNTVVLGLGGAPEGDFVDSIHLPQRDTATNPLLRKLRGLEARFRTGSRLGIGEPDASAAVEMLRRNGCKTLFAEYGHNALAVRDIAKRADCRLFVQFHGFDISSLLRLPGIAEEYRRLFKVLSGVIVGSNYLAKTAVAAGCPRELISIVPCGVDTDYFRADEARSAGGQRVIAVGRLTEKKAPHLTIEAFARVARKLPGATLDIIGEGEMRAACEKAIAKHGLEARVTLCGVRSPAEIREMLLRSDVFVQHSVTTPSGDVESFGISLVEAMACGLPVVVTRHNGFPDTIADTETGFLVEEHDVEAMAARILELLSNPELKARMSEAGKRRARTLFDSRETLARLRTVLGIEA